MKLDDVPAPGGGRLSLSQRGNEFVIRIDSAELMGSRSFESERVLAQLGCAGLETVRSAAVLVGGLGMGYTARAALDVLGKDARLDIAEIVPAVVEWNRGVLGPLAGHPLSDPRTRVLNGDVVRIIAESQAAYDAILLDVDNGPSAVTTPSNARLYSDAGLRKAARALRPSGVLAVWSASPDVTFNAKLRRAGFEPKTEQVRASKSGGHRHVLWIARRPGRK